MPLKLLTCVDFLATVYLVPVLRVFQALVVQTSEYQIPTAISTACLWNWKAFPWAKSVCTAIQEKKVNGSPRKLALLWARSDSRTVCRLFENRTGNAHQPSRRSLPNATGLQRWWRDAFFFLPPLLYRLMPIFNFVAVFPWIFLLWQFVYTVVCSLSLLCSSVFYIVNMYNCLSFVLWKKKVFLWPRRISWHLFIALSVKTVWSIPQASCQLYLPYGLSFLITQGISQSPCMGFGLSGNYRISRRFIFCFRTKYVQNLSRIGGATCVSRLGCLVRHVYLKTERWKSSFKRFTQ